MENYVPLEPISTISLAQDIVGSLLPSWPDFDLTILKPPLEVIKFYAVYFGIIQVI